MNIQLARLLVLVGLIGLWIDHPCSGQGEKKEITTRVLAGGELAVVQRAQKVVRDKVVFLREHAKKLREQAEKLREEGKENEAKAKEVEADSHDREANRFENEERAFEGVLGKGGVTASDDIPADAGAATRGPGNELDEKGAVKAGDTGNRVVLSGEILKTAMQSDCEADFLLLVRSILHVGDHLTQTLPTLPNPANIGPDIDTEAKANDLVNRKESAIRNEKHAYGEELLMTQQFRSALRAIDEGGTVPSWAEFLKNCDKDTIKALLQFTATEITRIENIDSELQKLLNTIATERAKQPPTLESQIARKIDNEESFREYVASGAKAIIGFSDDSSLIKVARFDGHSTLVDSGIAHPQDVVVIQDHAGGFKLVVCGFSDAPTSARGFVEVFNFPEPGVPPPGTDPTPIPKPIITKASALSCKTLCASNPLLLSPTSLMVAPDGRVFVWDVESAALYLLPDDDGDRVPDRIDLHSRVRIPRGFRVDHLATIKWIGDGPVLDWRIGQPVDQGDLPIFLFRNEGADGVFRSVLPRRWTQLLRHSK